MTETEFVRDFFDGLAFLQQLSGLLEPQGVQPSLGRLAEGVLEEPFKLARTHVAPSCQASRAIARCSRQCSPLSNTCQMTLHARLAVARLGDIIPEEPPRLQAASVARERRFSASRHGWALLPAALAGRDGRPLPNPNFEIQMTQLEGSPKLKARNHGNRRHPRSRGWARKPSVPPETGVLLNSGLFCHSSFELQNSG